MQRYNVARPGFTYDQDRTKRRHYLQFENGAHDIDQAAQNASQVLARVTTAAPLFPDSLILDRTKLTIIKRTFFMSSESISIRVEDILSISCSVGPLFGSIKILSRVFNRERPRVVNYLWRKDAIAFKHIAQGYIIALQNGMDCSRINNRELVTLLEQLGHEPS